MTFSSVSPSFLSQAPEPHTLVGLLYMGASNIFLAISGAFFLFLITHEPSADVFRELLTVTFSS